MVMDNIREGVKKPWAKILIFAIVISFVGAGYFTSALFLGDPNAVAVVNGDSVSRTEFQRAYSSTRQRYGEAYTQFIKTEEQERNFRINVLQNLISRKLTLQSTKNMGMRASDDSIRKVIVEIPALQNDGAFSSELLDKALVNIGMTRSQFKQSLQTDQILAQLTDGISKSEFVLTNELSNQYKYLGQKRSGRVLDIKYSAFSNGLVISDEEASEYYEANKDNYRQEEKITLDYIELSVEALLKAVTINDGELTTYYEENMDRYKSEESKSVSHILIASGEDTSARDIKIQETKINELKAKLDAGEDFSALAKTSSEDEFSAENGGDLGVVEKGAMQDTFDEAVASLANVGDISAPIKTDFGFHIIKLTGMVKGEIQPIDEVKVQITEALQKQKAEELFYERSAILEEKSFEISDSLTEVAESIEVPVSTSVEFSRSTATGIFRNPEVLTAAFSDHVIDAQLNSAPISISDKQIIVMRINKHQPSEIQSLELVKDKVLTNRKLHKSKKLAIEFANNIKSKLKSNESIDELVFQKSLKWTDLDRVERTGTELPFQQLQAFFEINKTDEGSVTYDSMESVQSYTLFVLNKVENGDLDDAEDTVKKQSEQKLSRFYSDAVYASMIEQLRNDAEIIENLANIER
ncbi:MAG: peptidyl-prolyl cis-trans isomerase D [Polaribacter sp.]|jgi:peptidyl-prolyl cis-trans isomerase D